MKQIVIIILSLALSVPAFAQNSGLRRLSDREDLLGWEAIGRLVIGRGGLCTGTLIAQDLVLTAGHCVFDTATGARHAPDTIMFQAGFHDGKSVAERTVAQIATDPGFVGNAELTADYIRTDVALLRLDAPIPVSLANPFALHSGNLSGPEISVASYGQGRTEAISRQRACRIISRERGLLRYDCNLTSGSSGSAILAKVGDRGRILSVHSAGGSVGATRIGYGMELPEIVARLKRQLRRDAPRPQGGVKRLQVGSQSGAGRSGTGAKFIRPSGS